MAIQEMSLPTDIKWKRLAASEDMMDLIMEDSSLPPRWKSSLAIFYADAGESDLYCDRIITYIKVICTITGYQMGEQELGYGFDPPSLGPIVVAAPPIYVDIAEPVIFGQIFTAVGSAPTGLWRTVRSAIRRKPTKQIAHIQTIELGYGQQLASSAEDIARSVQLTSGRLQEPPSVSVTPHVFTVELKPIRGERFAGNISYQVTNELGSWGAQTLDNYRKTVESYRPCHGAMLQVSVYPGKNDDSVDPEDYPYIIALEPKKRELYEAVTDSGETVSGSSSNVNVRKGTTSTSQTENVNIFGGGSIGSEFTYAGTGGGGEFSVSGEWGSRQRTGTESVNVVTTDSSREKRESLAHTTSLSQLYTLLQSYHVATNRSLFLMLPRPHHRQQFFSFANGPRELEGIQEFFLVVSRPKSVQGLCVSALLETGHVIDEERSRQVGQERYDYREVRQNFSKSYTGHGWTEKIVTVQLPDGYGLDWDAPTPAYVTNWGTVDYDDFPCTYEIALSDTVVQVTISLYDDNNEEEPTLATGTVVVKCKSVEPTELPTEEKWTESDLVITARRVAGCVASTKSEIPEEDREEITGDASSGNGENTEGTSDSSSDAADNRNESGGGSNSPDENETTDNPGNSARSEHESSRGDSHISESLGVTSEFGGEDWLTYETTIPITDDGLEETRLGRRIRVANLMIPRIARAMIESIMSPSRYKLGERRIGEARYIAREIARVVARLPEDHPINCKLEDIENLPKEAVERLQQLKVRTVSDLARNLPILDMTLKDPPTSRILQDLVMKVAGFQPKDER